MRCRCLSWMVLAALLTGCHDRTQQPGPDAFRPLDDALLETAVPRRECPGLSADLASRLVRLSLACAEREYPNKPDLTLIGDESLKPPRELWPAFFGCYDWHSAVHGHWSMLRVLKRHPGLPEAPALRAMLDSHLTPERLAREQAYFEHRHTRLFERPYGWGWLLRLQAELLSFDDPDGRRWAGSLRPLAGLISQRTIDFLDRLSVPVRSGTHGNTAYALAHMLDYARIADDRPLQQAIAAAAERFYLSDKECPTGYEPSGEDFISPCLTEADLMRRLLEPARFAAWLDAFLPPLDGDAFAPLRGPVEVRDPQDPRIGHLIGLSLQRAAALHGIAGALADSDPRRGWLVRMADWQCADGLARMGGSGYGGEHWLASFALFLVSGAGGQTKAP